MLQSSSEFLITAFVQILMITFQKYFDFDAEAVGGTWDSSLVPNCSSEMIEPESQRENT